MLKSMSGYGIAQGHTDAGVVEVVARSINSRFLDITVSIADELPQVGETSTTLIKETIARGKVDLSISLLHKEQQGLYLNTGLLEDLVSKIGDIKNLLQSTLGSKETAEASNPAALGNLTGTAMALLQYPGVLQAQDPDATEVEEQVLALVKQSLERLEASRCNEGQALRGILMARLDAMEEQLKLIAPQLEQLVATERLRIKKRLMQLQIELTPERFETEVALQAQKADIAEEYDRICCHLESLRAILREHGPATITSDSDEASTTDSKEACSLGSGKCERFAMDKAAAANLGLGKRLDFIIQELMRECNTLGAKASTNELSQIAVELKVLVEQMREQVQNIE